MLEGLIQLRHIIEGNGGFNRYRFKQFLEEGKNSAP